MPKEQSQIEHMRAAIRGDIERSRARQDGTAVADSPPEPVAEAAPEPKPQAQPEPKPKPAPERRPEPVAEEPPASRKGFFSSLFGR